MTPKFDIVAGSRTKVSDLESGYHNVLAMNIINIYLYKSYTNYSLLFIKSLLYFFTCDKILKNNRIKLKNITIVFNKHENL